MNNDGLYSLHREAVEEFKDGKSRFNWTLKFECEASELARLVILDVEEDAKGWRSAIAPRQLFFSHAQFYKDGIQHIVQELNAKPTSNRALYSLISQEHISKSGDKPIPSFLTLQCQIEENTLYCTCSFRALEVSKFLRTNLEEIRQTLVEIHKGAPKFEQVQLLIFAFHAYKEDQRSPLVRPRLDFLEGDELLEILSAQGTDPVKAMSEILTEVQSAVTSITPNRLAKLQRAIKRTFPGFAGVHKKFQEPRFLAQLDKAIAAEGMLAELRPRASRGKAVDAATEDYQQQVETLKRLLDL